MEMNPDAPGNVSQKGVNSEADNETGFDHRAGKRPEHTIASETNVDKELGFNPETPDVSDPQVDPTHPARTSNDPVPADERSTNGDQRSSGGRGI
ncbi:DUF6021 family protein [Pseudomonas bohemica]|uniref:DUF6021 family protein n=1 Tax=Pseudomonas bohemica TaxID=2044872 RepID=UPI000DA61F6A|nr:DUF6021 family protein [Pseudomonas bohemica]